MADSHMSFVINMLDYSPVLMDMPVRYAYSDEFIMNGHLQYLEGSFIMFELLNFHVSLALKIGLVKYVD